MSLVLRSYQKEAIEKIDIEFRKGNRRVLYVASPGAGKSEVAIHLMLRAQQYNYPSLFIVRGRDLVDNMSRRLLKNKVDHSVFMAGNWRRDPKKLIQVASVDTITTRQDFPFKDQSPLIILDEAHLDYKKIFEAYPNAFFIGLTGTPYSDMSAYNSYVETIKPYELRDQGHLVQDRIFCPHIIDTSAVKMRMGDFDKKQLQSVVTQSSVVGNIIKDWQEMGENRPTVCFATSIEHSLQLKQAFNDAGIIAVHCDASSSDEERLKARIGLEDGKIKVLCNVDIFSTGWDCPIVSCIILARPTWSLNWYQQAVGRGVRSSENKSDCIVLDNAGNVFRHGPHFKIREISLAPPVKKKSKPYDTRVTTCKDCYLVFDPSENDNCPECGWEIPKKSRKVNEVDGKLIEFEQTPLNMIEHRKKMIKQKYRDLEWGRRKNKLREDWTFIQLFKEYTREEMVHLSEVTRVPSRFLPLNPEE